MDSTHVPIIITVSGLRTLIDSQYPGLANVQLNKEIVEYLLSLNTNNRKIKVPSIVSYASSFKKYGYESIGLMLVSKTGVLMDGQHRLTALKTLFNSDEQIDAWQVIRFGVEDERMADIDNGVSRTFRDALALKGVVKDAKYATALRTYAAIISPTFRIKFTATELEEIYNNDFKQVFEIGEFLSFPGSGTLGLASYRPAPWVITAFRLCQLKYGTEQMKIVYEQFYNCQDLGCPMAFFRNQLIVNRGKFRFSTQVTGETKKVLGTFFNVVQKCLAGERIRTCSYLRPARLGLSINGNEF